MFQKNNQNLKLQKIKYTFRKLYYFSERYIVFRKKCKKSSNIHLFEIFCFQHNNRQFPSSWHITWGLNILPFFNYLT
uniref:Ovule protein n=1 Tax=Meloidogyne incognita TaxID=6306 RepID=A0A914MAG6_MELIC